jgi:hypothetical protein
MAIVQGFQPATRNQVKQTDTSNLEEVVKTAKLAESVEDTTANSTTVTVLSMMKTEISATETHSGKLDKLSQTVAGLQEEWKIQLAAECKQCRTIAHANTETNSTKSAKINLQSLNPAHTARSCRRSTDKSDTAAKRNGLR